MHFVHAAIDGRWSPWTGWSICGADCRQYKRRTCSNPGPAYGGRNCSGKDIMYSNCTGGLCKGKANMHIHSGNVRNINKATQGRVSRKAGRQRRLIILGPDESRQQRDMAEVARPRLRIVIIFGREY